MPLSLHNLKKYIQTSVRIILAKRKPYPRQLEIYKFLCVLFLSGNVFEGRVTVLYEIFKKGREVALSPGFNRRTSS